MPPALIHAAVAAAILSSPLTVRVDHQAGAPRLVVNGEPVRARIFFGGPGVRPLRIGPEGRLIEFEFTPVEDEPNHATMHLRFGQEAGNVYLDDLRVVEKDTGREVVPACRFESGLQSFQQSWNIWPPGDKNAVCTVDVAAGKGKDGSAALHVALFNPPDGRWPDFHFFHHANLALRAGKTYHVSLWAAADTPRGVSIGFYRPGDTYVYLGGPTGPYREQIHLAADAGVDLVSFPVGLPWPRPEKSVDWTSVDAACRDVLEVNPKALLIPRIGMDPPSWWRESHPTEVMAWDTDPPEHRDAVVASPVYRQDAAERLAALVAHLEEKFGNSVAGYHPCGQNTGEWFYQGTWRRGLNGYAEGDREAWRQWLTGRYSDDAALQKAWGDSQATLASVLVPTPEMRRAAPAGILRDPVAERRLIDFAHFQQQTMADCVCHLAHAARQASGGRKLVLFFYGYVFEFGAVSSGPSTSGHYALRRVLDCPDIDVLCSPISYFDRGLGQSAPAMTAAESVALAGKMWLYEDDTYTYLATGKPPGVSDAVDNLEDTNRELVRNTAQCAVRNFATWWMDLGATGWFNDPGMWAEMTRLKALDQPLLEHPLAYRPEIAAVIDEESMLRVAAGGHTVTVPAVYEVRRALGRMGAPYGQYLLDDVTAGRVHAKIYVLLTPWCLTPQQRHDLLAATRGSLRIWCYAPGYQEPERLSPDAMRELTGFRLKPLPQVKAWAEPSEHGKDAGLTVEFGVKQPLVPLFAVEDATADETLAAYPDGSTAVALRTSPEGSNLFVGPPGLTSELMRLAADAAGVHCFTRRDCNVYANGPYLVLHAATAGPMEIDTGHEGPAFDLLRNEEVGAGPKFLWSPKKGDTQVWRIRP